MLRSIVTVTDERRRAQFLRGTSMEEEKHTFHGDHTFVPRVKKNERTNEETRSLDVRSRNVDDRARD